MFNTWSPGEVPDFSVVRVDFAIDCGRGRGRKHFFPTAAPEIIKRRPEGYFLRSNARILPDNFPVERLVDNAPDSSAKLRKHDDSEGLILPPSSGRTTMRNA